MTKKQIEAEKEYADWAYANRKELERRAVEVIESKLRQLNLRVDEGDIAIAKRQAKARGLKYQSYMKSLLHQALMAAENVPPAKSFRFISLEELEKRSGLEKKKFGLEKKR